MMKVDKVDEVKEARNFLIGLGIGLGLAFLLAPQSGSELRDDISERANDIAESTRERFDRLRKKVENDTEDLTQTAFR